MREYFEWVDMLNSGSFRERERETDREGEGERQRQREILPVVAVFACFRQLLLTVADSFQLSTVVIVIVGSCQLLTVECC
jgi:hypothetical protein